MKWRVERLKEFDENAVSQNNDEVLYEVNASENWMIVGKKRGHVSLSTKQGSRIVISILCMPLMAGYVHPPKLGLPNVDEANISCTPAGPHLEILEKYYAAECAINSYQKGIQQQLGIMRGLIHRLDARRERSVHSPTAGHSGYAGDDFPEAEHDSPYARYDMPFHRTEEVPDTPIRHLPIIGARMEEVVVVSDTRL
ncbi:hypothetical protein VitviT2T_021677 [Vitis vinifera]|uniref:TRAPPC10/Trs130 C-terminal domain-containing protein n=1 Tax=Vitis vinifera TaxID=29760 RepID=A0ABY9D864_VITVI|nr:hypothetical protein VitviT2T_021677 [Vitis vinifera]